MPIQKNYFCSFFILLKNSPNQTTNLILSNTTFPIQLKIQLNDYDLKLIATQDLNFLTANWSSFNRTYSHVSVVEVNVLTLENYAERYVPLVMINTTMELLATVLDEKRLKKMNKAFNRMHNNLSKSILED